MIIGITGTVGAGKKTVVEYLVKKHQFKRYSVEDFLIRELTKRDLDINDANMVALSNTLRIENSPNYVIEELFSMAQNNNCNSVIESLETVREVEAAKDMGDFYLLAIDSNMRIRYERTQMNSDPERFVSFEDFQRREKQESGSTNPTKRNLFSCIEVADFVINNNGTLEELSQEIEEICKNIFSNESLVGIDRPDDDEIMKRLQEFRQKVKKDVGEIISEEQGAGNSSIERVLVDPENVNLKESSGREAQKSLDDVYEPSVKEGSCVGGIGLEDGDADAGGVDVDEATGGGTEEIEIKEEKSSVLDDKLVNIHELKQRVKSFCDERDWEQFHDAKELAIALSVEASELLEHFIWKSRDETNERINHPERREEIKDELSDCLYFILRIAQMYDIDLSSSLVRKLEKNGVKYPSEKSFGKKDKYNEL